MVTIKELERENKRLRETKRELIIAEKRNKRRKALALENKRLSRGLKFRKSSKIGKEALKITKDVGKQTGKVLAKTGIGAFKGIRAYGRFLEEQEKKQRKTNRKLRTVKKKIKKVSRRKTKKRKK